MGAEGMVWGVTGAALPLAPGATLILAIGDAYYLPEYTSVALPLTAGRAVYVQVDSYGEVGDYGAILESHEQDGQPYNNISGPAPGAQTDAPGALELQPLATPEQTAPPRRRRMLTDPRTREVK